MCVCSVRECVCARYTVYVCDAVQEAHFLVDCGGYVGVEG